jgi:type I restriction enzyme S subunit
MSGKALASIPFPLPPLAEQHRIVAKVDELMALCDRLEAQQADAESAHAQLVATLLDSLTRASDSDDFAASWQRLSAHFHTLFTTESSIEALKQTLLQLAVMGKLVPQDSSDEPVRELLRRIAVEKARLIDEGKIRPSKSSVAIVEEEKPFLLPEGWTWVRKAEAFSFLNGYAFKSEWFRPTGVRLLRNVNVSHGGLDWKETACISVDQAAEFEGFQLAENDVVLTLDRPIISSGLKYAVIKSGDLPCLLLQRVARISPYAGSVAIGYLSAWLNSRFFVDSIDPGRSNGVPHISTNQVASMIFALPPITEQHRIVAKLDQLMDICDNLRIAIQQRNQHSRHLADALVEKALSPVPETSTNVVDLSCYLVSRLATKPTFGRTAHMKLIYLADTYLELNLDGNYMREAAGPLDMSIYRVEEQAEVDGWYTHTSAPLKSGKEKVTYHATSALAAKARKFADELGRKRKELDRLISVLGDRNTEELEIVATLFAAWNDALLDGQSPGDDWIIREFRENWHIEKQRFSPDQLCYWLNWMRDKRLVPSGTGRHTQHQTRLL